MQKSINQLKQFLAQYGYTEPDLNQLVSMCEVVKFKKGHIVMTAGEIQNQIYFICNGIVRNFILNMDGKVKTYGFRMENMTCTGYSNYNYANDLKAKNSVECLEDCIMIKIPFKAIEYMVNNCAIGDRVGRFLAEYHVMELVDFHVDMETKSLIERYYNLDKKFPNLLQRVPQHMIASYLGTTSVHLSRVKNLKK
jgi:CRP-like cAMP-binding protein